MTKRISALKRSLFNINWRLYAALLIMGLCPTIYTTVRTHFLGQLPGDWSFSIAGQLTWVNLLYEVLEEAIILPLFFILGTPFEDRKGFSNRVKTGAAASVLIYCVFGLCVCLFVRPMLQFMAADPSIINESATYIRIESLANVFGILYKFLCVAIIATGSERIVYILTGAKLGLSVLLDTFLVSTLPVSLNLGVNGIGISNIVSNTILAAVALIVLANNNLILFRDPMSFSWFTGSWRIGVVSGIESLVRNLAYILMVSRMVNMVGEQGTYWVANNFIWGWLLLPVLQLGELIKQETSSDAENIRQNTPGYFLVTFLVSLLWLVTIPLYKPFMANVLNFENVDRLFELVCLLLPFYIFFAFQNVFDATFYGRGKTEYMLFESIVTNTVFYGGMFVAYRMGVWVPTLTGIALMFGLGNVFDSVVSGLAYAQFRKSLPETKNN